MKDTVSILRRLGFGDYEARAYLGSAGARPMTRYEVAEEAPAYAGIPQAKTIPGTS